MLDRFHRKIDYARISLTNLCNLECSYCSQCSDTRKGLPLEFYKNLIDALAEIGVTKIRFTGGEPLLNINVVELIKHAKSKGSINDICITTNGILLDRYIDDFTTSGLTRINFSLDTIDRDLYKKLTGKDLLNTVIDNIKLAKAKGLKVKINTVLLKTITDVNIEEFLNFGFENDIQIRFIELMPIGENVDYYKKYFLSSNDILENINCTSINNKSNDVATYYKYNNKYEFGIISAISNHFCERCNRIRITSKGSLRLCLHSDNEVDLLKFKNDKNMILKTIEDNIMFKPEKHLIDEKSFVKSDMVSIGG